MLLATTVVAALSCDGGQDEGAGTDTGGGGAGQGDSQSGAGGASASGGAQASQPSDCVALEDLPLDCDELCAAQGQACDDNGCRVSGGLASTTFFYDSLDGCQRDRPVLTELVGCDHALADTAALIPIPFSHVRCCCSGDPTTSFSGLSELCAAACDAARPDYTDAPECELFDSCETDCVAAVSGQSLACASCVADAIYWPAGGCNDFECQCPGPIFPDPQSPACASSCGS